MARIRTIKPEFPQSETMGKLSRDARLLFIMLWTICDDEGRARASSRMLASLLFPYDDDARALLPEWLIELDKAGVIRVYEVEGNSYLEIPKWLNHQKIDHKTPSRLPPFREDSRKLASDPETLAPHIKDLGPVPRTKDQDHSTAAKPGANKRGTRLTDDWQLTDELRSFASDLGLDPGNSRDEFVDFWTSVPGSKGLKLDWAKTFKNRCRELASRPKNVPRPAMKTFDQMRRDAAATVAEEPWDQRMRGWHMKRFWHNDYGPEPGQPGCRVPPQFLVAA